MNETSPDLDDGWLPIAHELLAVVACAGFSKWELIVLREVFDQVFGFHKPKTATARVSPSEVAGRLGTMKQSIMRAIKTLVDSGVLVKVGECEYRFIKNYGAWKAGNKPRFTSQEIAYCRAARKTNIAVKSKPVVSQGTTRQESLPLFDTVPEPI
ncbi:MAG: replication protein, partial [Cyanobacteria bacterium REEB65]|nr:replication protein [Cyanobacteria bacterium REEB65]